MPSKGRPRVVVRLDPTVMAQLKAAATARARPGPPTPEGVSGIIRDAITAWLAQARATQEALVRRPLPPQKQQTLRVTLWLRVENNQSGGRGKKRTRAEIEDEVLARYEMEKPRADGWEYILTIPYDTDDELTQTIHEDILREARQIAHEHRCFTESDVRALDGSERSW